MPTISQKIGILPGLGWVWDHGWAMAAVFLFAFYFGLVYLFMFLETLGPNSSALPPWQRTHYRVFLWGGAIWIPLLVALVVLILEKAPPMPEYFFAQRWWHISVLIACFVASILMVAVEVDRGQYTWGQVLSPSKLAHTLLAPVVWYWLVTALPPVIFAIATTRPSAWTVIFVIITVLGLMWMFRIDGARPQPWSAHPDGTWPEWNWHVRKR